MAEAVVDLQASDIYSMGTNFNPQSDTPETKSSNVQSLDKLGNVACQRNFGTMTDAPCSYEYCSGTDFVTDMGTALTAFGDVKGSYAVTGLTITCSAAGYATIDFTGHNHEENAHVAGLSSVDVSDFLPHGVGESFASWDGFGVPDFGVTLGDNATPTGATISFSLTHNDKPDGDGDHFTSVNITPQCDLTMDFLGIPTSNTAALIEADLAGTANGMFTPTVDSVASPHSNTEQDTFSFVAHANPLMTVA